MRPPGTSGLPDPWQRPLKTNLALNTDEDLPDLFSHALRELISEIKRNNNHEKRYPLEKGKFIEEVSEGTLYRFPFADEAELFQDARVEILISGRRIEGSIVSIVPGKLVIALKEYVGDIIDKTTLIIDTTALLEALISKIGDVKSGVITINRAFADTIAGREKQLNHPETIFFDGSNPAQLNFAQISAFQEVMSAPLTWIWGPPGCGKTKTLGSIVQTAFEAGHRILVCSNTNKAVDQVLYSICETLKEEHPAMYEGKVLRLGRITDNKLEKYGGFVTLDGISKRLTKELYDQKEEVEKAILHSETQIKECKRILKQFAILTELESRFKAHSVHFNQIQHDHDTLKQDIDTQSKQRARLDAELKKRKSSYFKVFRRSEEEILRDIRTVEATLINSRNSLQWKIQKLEDVNISLNRIKAEYEEKRRQLSGKEEKRTETELQKHIDNKKSLLSKLQDLEAQIANIQKSIIQNSRIIGATCTKSYLSVKDMGQFDLVIIDEASMVLLPVAWFVAGLSKQRVVICGDFRQIPPIVQSDEQAIHDVIGKDPFTANAIGPGDNRLKMLDTQYRMDEQICDLISEPMYGGNLRTAKDRKINDIHCPEIFSQPLTIVDTSDLWPFETQSAFYSRFNLMHAILARNIAFSLKQESVIQSPESFGICTPYAAQSKIIQKLMTDEKLEDLVQAGTVHSYQGDERDVILFDTTESYGGARYIGHFLQGIPPEYTGARLMNVAISRAKERLIILANLTYLDNKLPSSALLRSVLFNMQENGSVICGKDVLALRPYERDLEGLIHQIPVEEITDNAGIFDEAGFERACGYDMQQARESIVIFSGYITLNRVGQLGDLFRSKINQGVKIRCITRPPSNNGSIPLNQGKEALDLLENIGVIVDCRAKIHQKICIIDNKIVWQGSLNALSHSGRSDETMTRVVSKNYAGAVAGHMSRKRISLERAASTITDSENPRCIDCSGRTYYCDGRNGPYFRCEEGCGWTGNLS